VAQKLYNLPAEYRHMLIIFNTLLAAVQNILQLNSSAQGAHCCVYMATLYTFILLTATFTPATVTKGNVPLPVQTLHRVTLYVHCLTCSFGAQLLQISAKPKCTAHTDQLYCGYERVNYGIQMQNVLHFMTILSEQC
jgi:hypothetical protein